MNIHSVRPPNGPNPSHKEPMLNVEDPTPFWMISVLLLCYLGYVLSPATFKDFLYQAGVLASIDGHVILEERPLGNFPTLLTHILLHANWGHVLMNCGFILAFGIITIRGVKYKDRPLLGVLRRGSTIFLAIFLLGTVAGGLAQWLQWFAVKSGGIALGASTGGAALFASAAWVIGGKSRLLSFGIILVLLDAFNIVMGAHPAWAGHLGGYLMGAILAPLWVRPNSSGIGIFR